MKPAISLLNTADLTTNRPSASMTHIPTLNRRQLLSGMAATAALLAAKPWALAPAGQTSFTTQPMDVFEELRIFLEAGARLR